MSAATTVCHMSRVLYMPLLYSMLSEEERLRNGRSLTSLEPYSTSQSEMPPYSSKMQSSVSESRRRSSPSAAWLQPLQRDHRKLIIYPKEMNLELLPCSKFLTDLLNYIKKSKSSDRPSESIVNSGLCPHSLGVHCHDFLTE